MKTQQDQTIKSYLRIRPIPRQQNSIATVYQNKVTFDKLVDQYTFNRIFGPNLNTEQVYNETTLPIIQNTFEACIIAYGQTCSGKTHTMKGQFNEPGLIPLTVGQIFKRIKQNKKIMAKVKISSFEIYNEVLIDLIGDKKQNLEIRQDYKKNITIVNLSEYQVTDSNEALRIYQMGQTRRKFAPTMTNNHSSRSHTIFRIQLEVVKQSTFCKTISYIHMVDLAGSQGVNKTKAEGITKKQGDNINKSLLALSNVIRSLSQKNQYVNFRDSKLTRILQSSLCANSRSIVICTIFPTFSNLQQTINTIKFGTTANKVKVNVKQNIFQVQNSNNIEDNEELLSIILEGEQLKKKKKQVQALEKQNQQLYNGLKNVQMKLKMKILQCNRLQKRNQNLENQKKQLKEQNQTIISVLNEKMSIIQKQNEQLKKYKSILDEQIDSLRLKDEKLENNQKFLTNKIKQYERQLENVNKKITDCVVQYVSQKKSNKKSYNKQNKQINCFKQEKQQKKIQLVNQPFAMNKFNKNLNQKKPKPPGPITLQTVLILDTKIIQLNQQLLNQSKQIVDLQNQRDQLQQKLQKLKINLYQQEEAITFSCRKSNNSQNWEYRRVLKKIQHLKRNNRMLQKRSQRLKRNLDSMSKVFELAKYQQWLQQKNQLQMQRLNSQNECKNQN